MDALNKKKKPSRVQGSWGGGGAGTGRGGVGGRGGGSQLPRRSGPIGQRLIGEKLNVANFNSKADIPNSSQISQSPRTSADELERDKESEFVFHQPTDKELFRKPPDVIAIQDEGICEISTGPTGSARLKLFPHIFDKKEADWIFDDLVKLLPWRQQTNKKEGREEFLEPRLTAWFGDFSYKYSGVVQDVTPWSPIVTMLKDRVEELTAMKFNSCLANYYRNDKDSIGWHSDDEPVLGKQPVIASLSFGDVRVFELRKKPEPPDDRDDYRCCQLIKMPLPHGSLLIMEGATQEDWQHRVPKEYHDRQSRINLTFRTIFPDLDTA